MASAKQLTIAALGAAASLASGQPVEGPWYIFGYGSLLSSASRIRSDCKLQGVTEDFIEWTYTHFNVQQAYKEEDANCIEEQLSKTYIASKIPGARRGWYEAGGVDEREANDTMQRLFLQPTYLGLYQDDDAFATGLLYPVSDEELASSDERESAADYDYKTLSRSEIEFYGDNAASVPDDARIRVYFSKLENVDTPSELHPIVQSYVDVFLGGAIEIEEKNPETAKGFALTTCKSTFGWDGPWLNDRPYPKYRASFNSIRSKQIDALLLECAEANTNEASDSDNYPLTFAEFDQISIP